MFACLSDGLYNHYTLWLLNKSLNDDYFAWGVVIIYYNNLTLTLQTLKSICRLTLQLIAQISLTNSERENSKIECGREFVKEIENKISGGFTFSAICFN